MGQETRTIVIYSGQHLLQQTQEVKATSKNVSTADKPGKSGLEKILSIRFQEFICFYLFIFRRASAPDFQNLIGTSHKLEVQQSGKKRHTIYLKDYSHRLPYMISTLATASVHGYMWHHSQKSPLGFSQLLFAQIYGICLWERANKGATLSYCY